MTRTGGYGVSSLEVAVFLSIRELKAVRAALLAAIEGDTGEWDALSDADMDIASDLLDALPVFGTGVVDADDDGSDDDEDDEDD